MNDINDINCEKFFIYIMIHITNYIFNISEHIVKKCKLSRRSVAAWNTKKCPN